MENSKERRLTTMAKNQQNGITKLLRLRNCQIGKITTYYIP